MTEIEEREDGWYWWDETWTTATGPYPMRHEAEDALDEYVEYLLGT